MVGKPPPESSYFVGRGRQFLGPDRHCRFLYLWQLARDCLDGCRGPFFLLNPEEDFDDRRQCSPQAPTV
jgi:hypothetical protein